MKSVSLHVAVSVDESVHNEREVTMKLLFRVISKQEFIRESRRNYLQGIPYTEDDETKGRLAQATDIPVTKEVYEKVNQGDVLTLELT